MAAYSLQRLDGVALLCALLFLAAAPAVAQTGLSPWVTVRGGKGQLIRQTLPLLRPTANSGVWDPIPKNTSADRPPTPITPSPPPPRTQDGILTHYGGAQDGMNPNNPSFGTIDVSWKSQVVPCSCRVVAGVFAPAAAIDKWPGAMVVDLMPSTFTVQGACGYGAIPKDKYPYFSVAALSPSNKFSIAGPLKGCGECFEIQCVDPRPGVCYKDSSGNTKSIVVMISGE